MSDFFDSEIIQEELSEINEMQEKTTSECVRFIEIAPACYVYMYREF